MNQRCSTPWHRSPASRLDSWLWELAMGKCFAGARPRAFWQWLMDRQDRRVL